jgi:hypothetical protein
VNKDRFSTNSGSLCTSTSRVYARTLRPTHPLQSAASDVLMTVAPRKERPDLDLQGKGGPDITISPDRCAAVQGNSVKMKTKSARNGAMNKPSTKRTSLTPPR